MIIKPGRVPDMDRAHVEDVMRAIDKGRLHTRRCPKGNQWDTFISEFDEVDCFILENWRVGLTLRDKPPRKAVELVRAAKVISISPENDIAVDWYKKRRHRLGLKRGRK
ncbi:MAG TPA: hypothetical protein VFA51_07270 [Candidatus Udaeobacter sp.]|nr:hypothetical protein [Candidatus Udaeobacter sp.]